MPGDVLSGRYPLSATFAKLLGFQQNSIQPNIAPRSNLELPGIGSLQDAAAALTSGKVTLVPVPVEPGDVYQYVDVLAGATSSSSQTHSFAALYNSAGTLVGVQSTDGGATQIAASGRFTFTLGGKYVANSADSPNGVLYVGLSSTAGTNPPSLVSGSVPTAVQYAAYATSVPFYAATAGSAVGGTAPASVTLGSVTVQAAVPVVVLR